MGAIFSLLDFKSAMRASVFGEALARDGLLRTPAPAIMAGLAMNLERNVRLDLFAGEPFAEKAADELHAERAIK